MNKWPIYFMNIAKETAKLSKDPITKVGAVLTKDKHVKSIGYNGAPKSFPDELIPKDSESDRLIDQKNSYMCHAELNAILNYDGQMADLNGCTLYTTISPCHNCALMLAQLGVKRVIYLEKYHRSNMTEVTDKIFNLCHIENIDFKDIDKYDIIE